MLIARTRAVALAALEIVLATAKENQMEARDGHSLPAARNANIEPGTRMSELRWKMS